MEKKDGFNNGYPFNVIMTSPKMGDIINFYSKFININKNNSFFNTVYNYEKKLNKQNDKNKIFLNMAFKIDTLHDFTDSRSIVDKQKIFELTDIKDYIDWNIDEIKKSYDGYEINEIDDVLNMLQSEDRSNEDVEIEETVEDKDSENAEGEKKISSSSGFENEFFYWLIDKHLKEYTKNINEDDYVNKMKDYDVDLYVSSCIENFSNIISKQNLPSKIDGKNQNLNIVIDATEKRINNFKDLLLFQKYLNIKTNTDENKYCEIQKEKKNLNSLNIKMNEENQLTVVNLLKTEKNNLQCKIIFPQLFDANATSGHSIKWRNIEIQSMIEDTGKNKIDFDIINDTCSMSVDTTSKNVEYKIYNNLYTIREIKVIQNVNDNNYKSGKLYIDKKIEKIIYVSKYNNKETILNISYNTYNCYKRGPGVNELCIFYKNKIEHLNKNIEYLFKYLDEFLSVYKKTNYEQKITDNNYNLLKQNLNKIIETNDKIININDKTIETNNIKLLMSETKNSEPENRSNLFEKYDFYEMCVLLILFLEIKTSSGRRISNIKQIFIYKYKKLLANNIFTIKRSGDYSQIYYCKNEEKNYIFSSNDRMSASFCFIEKVNFIGPFIDSGIFLNFNKNIIIEKAENSICEYNENNCYPYKSITVSPDIGKYIKFVQFNEYNVLNLYDELYKIEYNLAKVKDVKTIYKNLAFKLDTIHDFIGSRSDIKIDNLCKIIWNTQNENTIENIIKIIKKLKHGLEKNFLFWILQKQSPSKQEDNSSNKYMLKNDSNKLPKITFSTSIENFSNCINSANTKLYFNIDASNESINNFKNMIISNFLSDKQMMKNVYEKFIKHFYRVEKIKSQTGEEIIEKGFGNIYEEEKKIYKDIKNKINDNDSFYKFINHIISVNPVVEKNYIFNYLRNYKSNIDVDKINNTSNSDIDNILTNIIDKIKSGYHKILLQLNKIIENINISSQFLDMVIIKLQYMYYHNIIIYFSFLYTNVNTDENKNKIFHYINTYTDYKNKLNSDKNLYTKDLKKKSKLNFKKLFNEIDDYYKHSVKKIENDYFIDFIKDNLQEGISNINFKITPPQLLDSNATTGRSIKIKSVYVTDRLDKEGKYCKEYDSSKENCNYIDILDDKVLLSYDSIFNIEKMLKYLSYDDNNELIDKISYQLYFSCINYKINNNYYPIQNIKVISLINKDAYKSENLKNKLLN
jgi:hypothetical protein